MVPWCLCVKYVGRYSEGDTVIFGDYIVLDHVSTAHFPSFLVNSQDQVVRQEEEEDSHNYVKMGEEWR